MLVVRRAGGLAERAVDIDLGERGIEPLTAFLGHRVLQFLFGGRVTVRKRRRRLTGRAAGHTTAGHTTNRLAGGLRRYVYKCGGEQMSRRRVSEQRPSAAVRSNGPAALARPLVVGAALLLGLALTGSGPASAAGGSRPPEPRVLWHAYTLDSAQSRGAGDPRSVKPAAPPARRASATASGRDAAQQGGSTLSGARVAAVVVAVAAATAIAAYSCGSGLLLLFRRRRGGERRRPEPEPIGDDSDQRRRLFDMLAEEDGSLAPARRGERREREEARPSAEEKAALKRTSEAAHAEAAAKLKAKGPASAALKDASERDLTAIKAKLGQPRTSPNRPPAEAKRVLAAHGTPAPAENAAVRPDADVGVHKPSLVTQAATPTRCRIEWLPDGNESVFCAAAASPTGEKPVLLTSPSFAWKEDGPPSKDLPPVESAHRALVSKLIADGWVATGIGARWYELELERTPEHIRTTN
jgi:hypothetical protein